MPNRHQFYPVLKLLFLLICLWAIIGFVAVFYVQKDSKYAAYLPEDVAFTIRINTRHLTKNTLYDILYKASKDEIGDFNLQHNFTNLEDYGIDWQSEIIYFQKKHQQSEANGFIFPIRNKQKFLQYPKAENRIIQANDNYGVILYLAEESSPQERVYFKNYVDDLLTHPTINDSQGTKYKNADFVLTKPGDSNDIYKQLQLGITIEKGGIHLTGQAHKSKLEKPNHTIVQVLDENTQEEALTFTMNSIPKELQQTLFGLLPNQKIVLPNLTRSYVQFYHTSILNVSGQSIILPSFNALLTFDDTINIKATLNELGPSIKQFKMVDSNTFVCGNKSYYFQQLTENSFYLGVDASPKILSRDQKYVARIQGDPTRILDIQGESWAAKFINMLPQVRETKHFLAQLEQFELTIQESEDEWIITGDMQLQEEELMSIELLKLLQTLIY